MVGKVCITGIQVGRQEMGGWSDQEEVRIVLEDTNNSDQYLDNLKRQSSAYLLVSLPIFLKEPGKILRQIHN